MQRLRATVRTTAIQWCSLLIAGLISAPAWAHPGHGVGGDGWNVLHYLTEPVHIVAALGLALLVAGPSVWRTIRARRARQVR